MKPVRTWILIADGAQARVVLNDGPGHGIKPVEGMEFSVESPPNRDLMSDKAGRVFDSEGAGRHAMAYTTDPHQNEKRRFAEQLAQCLYEKLNENAFDRMIIFASPAMLGELRSSLSPHVLEKVTEQVPKDLINVPANQLAKHIEEVLAI